MLSQSNCTILDDGMIKREVVDVVTADMLEYLVQQVEICGC